ncbi:MAG: Mrp/NBP35 family ATP-binding protein [Deltaproteobacteria bacterium]|nr:Mrp/NBP35 family ATP-binding protein [Deltaproteobacteria bacterium]
MFGLGKKEKKEPVVNVAPGELSAAIKEALGKVQDPDMQRELAALGSVREVNATAEKVTVALELHSHQPPHRAELETSVRETIAQYAPNAEVALTVTASIRAAGGGAWNKQGVTGVRNVILVGSGKGGVGKSTVASNIAVALAQDGAKVGLLDADIYGPSIPMMFGLAGNVRVSSKDGKTMEPLDRHGLKLMSIGFLTDPDTPMVWRGPMVANACMQLFKDVGWAPLDYLIVDLPPGTGDIQLSLSQQIAVAGAVLVSTPQDVAVADVRRAQAMFEKVGIGTLGLVENMSFFVCDGCNKRHEIFDSKGEKNATRLGVPYLGGLPLETPVRQGGDEGTPVVLRNPSSAAARAFVEIARTVALHVARAAVDSPREEPPPPPGQNPLLRVMG